MLEHSGTLSFLYVVDRIILLSRDRSAPQAHTGSIHSASLLFVWLYSADKGGKQCIMSSSSVGTGEPSLPNSGSHPSHVYTHNGPHYVPSHGRTYDTSAQPTYYTPPPSPSHLPPPVSCLDDALTRLGMCLASRYRPHYPSTHIHTEAWQLAIEGDMGHTI
jgi:hypothetical protein